MVIYFASDLLYIYIYIIHRKGGPQNWPILQRWVLVCNSLILKEHFDWHSQFSSAGVTVSLLTGSIHEAYKITVLVLAKNWKKSISKKVHEGDCKNRKVGVYRKDEGEELIREKMYCCMSHLVLHSCFVAVSWFIVCSVLFLVTVLTLKWALRSFSSFCYYSCTLVRYLCVIYSSKHIKLTWCPQLSKSCFSL